ncbi:MAG TPA: TonB-dependent receptor [Opitutaceae bacterium]|nr:TonB-dependent receptor [Opitutaceae bacterium]
MTTTTTNLFVNSRAKQLLLSLSVAGLPALTPLAVAQTPAVKELERLEVSASKIAGLNNQTIFQTNEKAALAYDVITREEIERRGVTNLEELFRMTPQTTDYGSVSLQGSASFPQAASGTTYQNSEVKLRGFSSLQTSVLINGRRLQRGNLSAGPDLNRIPLSAIERIEILPSSASALYGGGAIGGAINVILRQDYQGKELTVGTGTSWDGGASRYSFSYFEGISLGGGRTRLSYTLNYEHSDPLYNSDRNYLQNALERYPANTTATVSGRSVFEQYIIQGFNGMPGTILINSATGTLPIPGSTGARFAAIPAGQDGTALTPTSFTAGAGRANLGDRFGRSVIYRPEDRYAFTSQLEHDFVPDKLTLYAEADVTYFRSNYTFPQALASLSLSATDPLNPFRTGVTPGFVGVPVMLYYDPVDLPDPSLFQERQGARSVLGFKGKLSDNWEWSIDGTGEYGRSHSSGRNPTQNLNTFLTSTSTIGLTLAQRRALYNPLADHVAFPRYAQVAEFLDFNRQYTYYNYLSQVNLRAVGDVFELPAGALRISPGAEVIWSKYRTHATNSVSAAAIANIPVVGNSNSRVQQSRRTESVFLESVIPVMSEKWRVLPVEKIDLNLGVRWEGTDDSTDETSPVVAFLVGITPDVAVRASYAEGFFPPDQANFEGPRENLQAITPFDDPARGNLQYNYPHGERSGGNPDLRPETSKTWNYGVILTPRKLPGLQLTLDYWITEKVDAIVSPTGPTAILASPESYPGRIERAAPSADDLAKGWLGPVTMVDFRPVNVGFTKTNGVDIKLNYTREVGNLGRFSTTANATWTDSFRDQVLPINPIVERAGSSGNPLKWAGYGSVFWDKQAWTAGVTATYIDSYVAASTTPSQAFPTGNGLDGSKIASATLWDLLVSYRVPASRMNDRSWRRWLDDTKFTLSVKNVFNKEPAFRTDIYSYYSRYEDPRQCYITLSAKKTF